TLIYSEISHRRATGQRGSDILSLLLDAHDEDGNALSDLQIRDEVMTLLFAGHDTTTSTVSFMFYELARNPHIAARLRAEQDALFPGALPTAAQLTSGELTELELVLDETLRKYPPAWVGPRRSLEAFEFAGHAVPGRATTWRTCSPTRRSSDPIASRRRRVPRLRRAPTFPSAAARARASACGS